jgi:hypothetical protein
VVQYVSCLNATQLPLYYLLYISRSPKTKEEEEEEEDAANGVE